MTELQTQTATATVPQSAGQRALFFVSAALSTRADDRIVTRKQLLTTDFLHCSLEESSSTLRSDETACCKRRPLGGRISVLTNDAKYTNGIQKSLITKQRQAGCIERCEVVD